MAGRLDPLGSPAPPPQAGDPLARLMGLSTNDDKRAVIQQQLAQALALRNKPRQHYSTWGGALAGGLGDVVDNIHSKVDEDRLRKEDAALLGDAEARRGGFLDLPGARERLMAGLAGEAPPQAQAASSDGIPEMLRRMPGQTVPPPEAIPYPSQADQTEGLAQVVPDSQIDWGGGAEARPASVMPPAAAPMMQMPPMDISSEDPTSSAGLFKRMQKLPPGPQKDALQRQLEAANALRQGGR